MVIMEGISLRPRAAVWSLEALSFELGPPAAAEFDDGLGEEAWVDGVSDAAIRVSERSTVQERPELTGVCTGATLPLGLVIGGGGIRAG